MTLYATRTGKLTTRKPRHKAAPRIAPAARARLLTSLRVLNLKWHDGAPGGSWSLTSVLDVVREWVERENARKP